MISYATRALWSTKLPEKRSGAVSRSWLRTDELQDDPDSGKSKGQNFRGNGRLAPEKGTTGRGAWDAEHRAHARLLSSLHVFKDEKKPKPLEDGLLGVPETYGGGRDRAGGRDGSPTPLNVLCFAVHLWNT